VEKTAEASWFDSQHETRDFFYSTSPRLALGPFHLLVYWITGALSPGASRPGREADHFHVEGAKVKNASSLFHIAFVAWRRTTLPFI